ncbi:Fatty acid synthase subunit alpha [Smittium culicis]|uniref:Fatty acid synthase subunit alpha n=1 Tax=Smittium culicis TaxID=133412 RepID=A0A1R1X204_9FUNG|nr:Fatty acid synthase subunit alpha [Smittium culicis]
MSDISTDSGYVSIDLHVNATEKRYLSVKLSTAEARISIPSKYLYYAEQLHESFLSSKYSSFEEGQVIEEVELAARFLKFMAEDNSESKNSSILISILARVFDHFSQKYMKGNDIHVIVKDLGISEQKLIINAYYSAKAIVEGKTGTRMGVKTSALFDATLEGKVKLLGIFGGQSNTEKYFEETRDLYQVYEPLIKPFFESMSAYLKSLVDEMEYKTVLSKGMDIMQWIAQPESCPDDDYMISAPPGEMASYFKGVTGHSQGVIVATTISSSSNEEAFYSKSKDSLALLLSIGARGQMCFPRTSLKNAIIKDSIENNEGNPGPMVAVSNLDRETILAKIDETNKHLPSGSEIYLSLTNGHKAHVISGPAQSLYGLNLLLRKLRAPEDEDQSRIPFSKRKSEFHSRFLPITLPFHSRYLNEVPHLILKDLEHLKIKFSSSEMKVPVYSAKDGTDLRECKDLVGDLIQIVCLARVDWLAATKTDGITHIIDFGTGGYSGVGILTSRNKEGTGVRVIINCILEQLGNEVSLKSELFDCRESSIVYSMNWEKEFSPKLVRTSIDSTIQIDTPMSRLLGKPPIMVAGMTPTTVSDNFVSAVLNSGFHVELAGGGHYDETSLRSKVNKIMDKVSPGMGITLNCIFMNMNQWGFQFPLIQIMRSEGFPMEGLTIAAGVPSNDVADEIISSLLESGFRHVSFKPGSVSGIKQVINIAKKNPKMSIMLQWTGGRAGGHHSFEDMHDPILDTYSSIRAHKNIVLVCGSGFGGIEDTLPYITGDWSEQYGFAKMPFDGILYGSRMLVAKESNASDAVKQKIVDTPGIDDIDWEKTYTGVAGGITTVLSDFGEPIHKIATRGVMLWKELDETIFSIPRDKRMPIINEKKSYLIERLNKDYQKPWFGKKSDGSVADLDEMTYSEVALRLIELMFVKAENRWINDSYRDITGDFIKRIEERFTNSEHESSLQSYKQLDEPYKMISEIIETYPDCQEQILASEDVQYFFLICNTSGRKPVPFIPILDKDLDIWFKKDGLWQAEDLTAVVDRDVERVCILQGPVSAKYSTKINEPVSDILNCIYKGQIDYLIDRYYNGDLSKIPVVEYLSSKPFGSLVKAEAKIEEQILEHSRVYKLSENTDDIPETDSWLQTLSGNNPSWLRALIMSDVIYQGSKIVSNFTKRILRPRACQTVTIVESSNGSPRKLIVEEQNGFIPVEISVDNSNYITLSLNNRVRSEEMSLKFMFQYSPEKPYALIHEDMSGRNDRIKTFYNLTWFGDNAISDIQKIDDKNHIFKHSGAAIDPKRVFEYCDSIGNNNEKYLVPEDGKILAPMDFAITLGWYPICHAMLSKIVDEDLISLVHLKNEFRMVDGAAPFRSGDIIDSEARVEKITIGDAGKFLDVTGSLYINGELAMYIYSSFLYRGRFSDFENTYQFIKEDPMQLELQKNSEIAVLMSKEWFILEKSDTNLIKPGSVLVFRLETKAEFMGKDKYSSIKTTGTVSIKVSDRRFEKIGEVDYENGASSSNPVIDYLVKNGRTIEEPKFFENGGYPIITKNDIEFTNTVVPSSNNKYSYSSGDHNPIHSNPYFSDYSGLPGTIAQGMWTSASARKYVEYFAADNCPERVTSYSVTFLNYVMPNDTLQTKLYHVGMINGKKLIKVEQFNQHDVKVLDGMAEVDQPKTAYVFTGQGSQEVGMGMDLYEKSEVARKVWDTADAYLLEMYGYSILEIVRKNPKTKRIYFGGPKGERIRKNYTSMIYESIDKDGNVVTTPLFPEITEDSLFYTFSSPNGLIYATQFTQPSLLLFELAYYEDMLSNNLIRSDSPFAGHSLGEFSALGAFGGVLSPEKLIELGFYRGMTMQAAVKRDEGGKSGYGMIAANPMRIGKNFGEKELSYLVEKIHLVSKGLIEIVNYNVENWQYVIAGELKLLSALSIITDHIAFKKVDISGAMKSSSQDLISKQLDDLISSVLVKVSLQLENDGKVKLERSHATIPLEGIDVPFHSSFLNPGVGPFREFITKKLITTKFEISRLCFKYIPNITGKPFEISKEYFELVLYRTGSAIISECLRTWNSETCHLPEEKQRLGFVLIIELLSYQFSNSVRWIDTLDVFLKDYCVERVIEIGPSPILCGMVERTLKIKYASTDYVTAKKREILCISKDVKDIYYLYEPESEIPSVEPTTIVAVDQVNEPARPQIVQEVSEPASNNSGAVESIEDVPIPSLEILLAIVSLKVKKSVSEISELKSIKDLVGGKSAMQNEIVGDVHKEFPSQVPEKAEELSLQDLSNELECPSGLGKYTSSQISKMLGSKMPGGFNITTIKKILSTEYGLGPLRSDGFLVIAMTMEPESRLSGESELQTWIKSIANIYAERSGIKYVRSSSSSSNSTGSAVVINSKEFELAQKKQRELAYNNLESLASYLGIDLRSGNREIEASKAHLDEKNDESLIWIKEHGEVYADGIKPQFDSRKVRIFDSSWNWAKQDALKFYYDIVMERITIDNKNEISDRFLRITNRSRKDLIRFIEHLVKITDETNGPSYKLAKELCTTLIQQLYSSIDAKPVYKETRALYGPQVTISKKGNIEYKEVLRQNEKTYKDYVQNMKIGSPLTGIAKSNAANTDSKNIDSNNSESNDSNKVEYVPYMHLKRKIRTSVWQYCSDLTSEFYKVLLKSAEEGLSYKDKCVLVTGCGKGSIGNSLVEGLLSGGAQVIATTSSYGKKTMDYFQQMYQKYGANGSSLIVLPFNQASSSDVKALINYIYDTDPRSGLGLDVDALIPFGAISEYGFEISDIGPLSELSHRAMMTNVMVLIGEIKNHKEKRGIDTRPAQVILPLSYNQGVMGGDGLYSESKLSLETLFNRWESETWGEYLTITGTYIGWTRGTGLMNSLNLIADRIEGIGGRTFSVHETAFNILGLLSDNISRLAYNGPVFADLNGGLQNVPNFQTVITGFKTDIHEKAEIQKAIASDISFAEKSVNGKDVDCIYKSQTVKPKANLRMPFPTLKKYESLRNLPNLSGMLNLDKVVVITGFGEVGPYGNSQTRWEMEAYGEFSLEGCVELSWIMGYIKHFTGKLKSGKTYTGWVISETGEPIDDLDVKAKFEKKILEHTGIRLIEPELFGGYDPNKKKLIREIVLEYDMKPFTTTPEEASNFKLRNGDKVDVWENEDRETWSVRLLAGATLFVPKALKFDRSVVGQIPTGWKPETYGIPKDVIDQVDDVTLFILVATTESLLRSGITDPYEMYKYVHISEVGNTTGSGVGGTNSNKKMFQDRFLDKNVQSDILQESLLNTMAAWVNMLLISSSGPIKVPVGACASAAVSMEVGLDTIQSGKAKIVLTGGFDDFQEEGSTEFANMNATSNSDEEFAKGRSPSEMSRPATSTRAGFMESYGSGIALLMSAATAFEMGVPIYGIVALTNTATDKEGRSVPAPGQGILTTAKETVNKSKSPLLNLEYRRRQLQKCRASINSWIEGEYEYMNLELKELIESDSLTCTEDEFIKERIEYIQREAKRQENEAMDLWGNEFFKHDHTISPIRGALSVYGLTVDDIGVASFHGTSTMANDKNESDVLNKQLLHLGRTPGNLLPSIFQKYLTGHPKGPASSWMLNGMVQSMLTGLVPGNRNADNIDIEMDKFEFILYPSQSIQTNGIKAGLLKTFGFGQVGSEVLIIHPDYLLSSLSEADYIIYANKVSKRELKSFRYFQNTLTGTQTYVTVKHAAPYSDELESDVALNPLSRAQFNPINNSYYFKSAKTPANPKYTKADSDSNVSFAKAIFPKDNLSLLSESDLGESQRGVGVDFELVSSFSYDNKSFIERNFTLAEIEYCLSRPDPRSSFTGKWCAKEAAIKAVSSFNPNVPRVWNQGEAAPLVEIEILSSNSGAPSVKFHGSAKIATEIAGVKSVKVSISHSGAYAGAVAVAE